MEANRKRVQVHRIENITNEGFAWGELLTTTFKTPQHLYFTTDEEIKEDEWYYSNDPDHGQPAAVQNLWPGDEPMKSNKYCKKIIATTDPELTKKKCTNCSGKGHIDRDGFRYCHCKTGEVYNIAQPSQATIKAYCEQGGIDEVDVEYTEIMFPLKERMGIKEREFILKVDPIHNTITTHRIVEKTYSISDIEAYCEKYSNDTELGREIRKLRYKQ